MGWNPYTDQKNSAFVEILTGLFPEQTKTIPRIIVWSIIFIIDLIGVAVGGYYLGLITTKWGTAAILVALYIIFWLQGKIFYSIAKLFR